LALCGFQVVIGLKKPLTMDQPTEISKYRLTDRNLNTLLTQTNADEVIRYIVDDTTYAQRRACNQLF
jgi:hypothetical protein